MRCHLGCVFSLLESRGDIDDASVGIAAEGTLDCSFLEELRTVFDLSPQLFRRQPVLRVCYEEIRLGNAAVCWPPPELPAPPPAAFAIDGIVEIRISSCPSLRGLPPEIGLCHGLKALVLISDSLEAIPKEVGQLHELEQLFLNGNFLETLPCEVGELPLLQELCVDSNLITVLPPFTSPKLELFTAPANRLEALPALAGRLDRIDAHGNALQEIIPLNSLAQWDKIRNLKLMGNKLSVLPEDLGRMWSLRTLLVSGNQLKALPSCIAQLRSLQWLFAYNNEIAELPTGLLKGSSWLERVLLEGNPLSGPAVDSLVEEARGSAVKVLSLDPAQVRGRAAVAGRAELPACVSVGSLVHTPGSAQYYMKLTRASQLRRAQGLLAAGEPGGPAPPEDAPAKLLVVAFAASQGEPEWLGVLRRLALAGRVARLPPVEGPLAALDGLSEPSDDPEASVAALWSSCGGGADRGCPARSSLVDPEDAGHSLALEDFDVLSVIDHRMQWYTDDAPAFSDALSKVAAQHLHTLFVGASMGGFGALLHSKHLADAVVAFSPQSRLDHATLRPPGADKAALEQLSEQVRGSVQAARARGARVEVHCAADEHCWHALSLPLGDLCLTVHPLLPRKPFARLLDRAQLLEPIVADALCGLLSRAPGAPPSGRDGAPASAGAEHRAAVSRWQPGGRLSRHWAPRQELLRLLFGPGAPAMPRPGDWFCARCQRRNGSGQFFCTSCAGPEAGRIADAGVRRVPGGRDYLRSGDWGCGRCGAAMCGYDRACTACWSSKDHAWAVVVV